MNLYIARLVRQLGLLALVLTFQLALLAAEPVISRITTDGDDVVIEAQVPAGFKKITLQSRLRVDGSAWEPRAVLRLDGSSTTVTFRIKRSEKLELLRVRGDATDALPAQFFSGANAFVSSTASASVDRTGAPGAPVLSNNESTLGDAATRTVEESDIYKTVGDTLYIFNQFRGLQVVDISNPDAPTLRGTYEKAASGEELYVLNSGEVLLLTVGNCYYGAGPNSKSEVIVVDATGPTPSAKASVQVDGQIVESRMVGSALYLASSTYRMSEPKPTPGGASSSGVWEYGTVVTSIDLSNPASPVLKNAIFYPGQSHVISATEKYLLVSTVDYGAWRDWTGYQSFLHILDCSAPDGTLRELSVVQPYGQVQDKFKLNLSGDVLTIVSHRWSQKTLVETFSLATPTAPQKLGELTVIEREQLHATRFDGDTLYVVTFMQVDPLWVIDLSNPAKPSIVGELEVPGWSTYIQPMGDRLLALGIDNTNGWSVALSLFDVSNKAKPTLASKVTLDQYSWSEGNNNEKAFKVLESEGLLLLPYQTGSYWMNGGSRVRLIDFTRDSLTLRGFVEHTFAARRAFMHDGRVLSFSGKELVTVDVADRDKPVVTAELELSQTVNRVLVAGDYLLQIENGTQGLKSEPGVRISRRDNPATTLTSVTLTNSGPIVGVSLRNGRLHLAQATGRQQSYYWWYPVVEIADTNEPAVLTTIIDVSALPAAQFLGAASSGPLTNSVGSQMTAVWPKDTTLVWSAQNSFYGFIDVMPRMIAPGGLWYGGSPGREFYAFDVTNPAQPNFASVVSLTREDWNTSNGEPLAADNLVFQSHLAVHSYVTGTNINVYSYRDEKNELVTYTNIYPTYRYEQRYYLDVVDYENPSAPTVRRRVNIPGELRAISHGGAILYTIGQHYTTDKGETDPRVYLDASAYDGVAAFLVDSVALDQWHNQSVGFTDGGVAIARAPDAQNVSRIELYRINDSTAKLTRTASISMGGYVYNMRAFSGLLVTQAEVGYSIFKVGPDHSLELVKSGQPSGCMWGELSNGDVAPDFTLWLPANEYGAIPIPKP